MRYVILSTITLASIALFYFYPNIDLVVSNAFFDEQKGGFYLDHHFGTRIIYHGIKVVVGICIIVAVLQAFLRFKGTDKPWFFKPTKGVVLTILLLGLVPGLIVHEVIKPSWDRERPRHVVQFEGNKPFTTINEFGTGEGKSFVSGHTAGAFILIAFALLLQAPYRTPAYVIAFSLGAITALTRVAQGGHFLSDTVFAALLMLWLTHLMFDLFIKKED